MLRTFDISNYELCWINQSKLEKLKVYTISLERYRNRKFAFMKKKAEMQFKEFEPRFKSAKTRFKLSAGLNLETFDTILSGTNQI